MMAGIMQLPASDCQEAAISKTFSELLRRPKGTDNLFNRACSFECSACPLWQRFCGAWTKKKNDMDTGITATITVQTPPENAFRVFTRQLAYWWPRAYTWSQNKLERMEIETQEGGKCYETGPHGFRCDWGRVLSIRPPAAITFTWQVSPARVPEPDPDKAGAVTVSFDPAGNNATIVKLVHSGFDRYGKGWEDYAAAMGSQQGWPCILQAFREAIES